MTVPVNYQADQRLLDPIWGLVPFRADDETDQLAWALLNCPEFQRLRRIRQLGLAECVFPGATHSRFSHSVGVFHAARLLLGQIARKQGQAYDPVRAQACALTALLHDIGHGPCSHAFEHASPASSSHEGFSHEDWGAHLVETSSRIGEVLGRQNGLASAVASLLRTKPPDDIYGQIVSSQFDADRLDYLRRDRYMTGAGSGGFDFDWLLDCLTPAPDETGKSILCLSAKGVRNAEEYILARYYLYANIYTHKTTRAAELMLADILASLHDDPALLPDDHPLGRFCAGDKTEDNFLALDDYALWSGLRKLAANNPLAARLLARDFYKCRDVSNAPSAALDDLRANLAHDFPRARLEESSISAYGCGALEDETLDRIFILHEDGPRDVSHYSSLVRAIASPRPISRVYCPDDAQARAVEEKYKLRTRR